MRKNKSVLVVAIISVFLFTYSFAQPMEKRSTTRELTHVNSNNISGCPSYYYDIYFINNTNKNIYYHSYNNDGLATDAYTAYSGTAKPYQRVELFRVCYDHHITWGDSYKLQTDFHDTKNSSKSPSSISISTMLHGDMIGSSITGAGFNLTDSGSSTYQSLFPSKPDPSSYPYDVQLKSKEKLSVFGEINLTLYGAAIKHGVSSIQSTDEINYVLDMPRSRYERTDNINNLTILTYNTQIWPSVIEVANFLGISNMRLNEPDKRVKLIPTRLKNYDVVVAEELMDPSRTQTFINAMNNAGYPYHYGPIGKGRLLPLPPQLSGGAIIFSHWPINIKTEKQQAFGNYCNGIDCYSSKGVLYAQITKTNKNKTQSKVYNIFAAHMQAIEQGDDPKTKNADIEARDQQFSLVNEFIDNQNIPSTQPAIMVGDLNVNYQDCYGKKQCEEYLKTIGLINHGYALWSSENPAWGNISILSYGGDPTKNLMNTDSDQEMDDYIFPIGNYEQPKSQASDIRIIRGSDVAQMYDGGRLLLPKAPYAELDLSDHFPYESSLSY